jgi:threonyl-tRNA synthetase
MINVTLKGGVVRQVESGTTIAEIAKSLGAGLYKAACAATVDGKLCDLRTAISADCAIQILTFEDEGGRHAFNHTASHVLAQAVKRLYPQVKLTIGPAIDNGFYYDFDTPEPFTPEVLQKLEVEMKKIVKEELPLEKFELSPADAIKLMEEKDEPYKIELIDAHASKGENISFYKQGEFTELCAGPHIPDTGRVKAFKLTQCTGAYWHGDSKNKMLQRVYGIAFPKAAELEAHLAAVEDAKKRDHNKIGRELGYFTTVDYIGQGLPIMLPKGARVLQILERFVEDVEESRGYLLTKTPFMAKNDLYKISGHWDHYQDGMFVLGDESKDEEVFALRPMTCPFQFQVYLNKSRSYRELPMRLNETSTLFRNEASGEMHGLIRLRQFTISEGHIACTPEQLENEFKDCLDLAGFMLKTLGLDGDVSYRFSKWDENNRKKYIGAPEQWESAQNLMRTILNDLNVDFVEADGEAAFYGPKLDIQIKNVFGKEDTLITIQIDFQLAQRFGMEYVDADGQKKFPYVIHRTSIGCYERTLALLLEKYAGALPVWLAPVQVKVLPISEKHEEYAKKVTDKLKSAGIRVESDVRNEKIGYRIREAQLEKVPYMLVLGDKELESGSVAVRARSEGDRGAMSIDNFMDLVKMEIDTKAK